MFPFYHLIRGTAIEYMYRCERSFLNNLGGVGRVMYIISEVKLRQKDGYKL